METPPMPFDPPGSPDGSPAVDREAAGGSRGGASPGPAETPAPAAQERRWTLPAFLFLATFVTTTVNGVAFEAGLKGIPIGGVGDVIRDPSLLVLGLPYSLSILAILGCHEMGHYIACIRYRIDATPPFFLPSPFLIGTFGAFIRIRAPITNRKALFDIGVAGPLAGFAVAVPVLVFGVLTSGWVAEQPGQGGLFLGDCLATRLLIAFVASPPPSAQGYVFSFGGMAMAGWVGLLATAINLLPVGQLDGGHMAYAISPRLHLWTSRIALAGFVLLGVTVNEVWLFWATVLILLNPRHPRLIEERGRLTAARLAVAALGFAVFVLSFIPSPTGSTPGMKALK